jgi:hypothetical protein
MKTKSPKPEDSDTPTSTVIEFYVPDGHKAATRWIPENLRGRLLEFPNTALKKPA